jgi:hypothetical protein
MASGDTLSNHQIATRAGTAVMGTDTTAGTFATETVILTLVVALTAGRRYAVKANARCSSTVNADSVLFRVREDTVAGTQNSVNRVWLDADSAGIGCECYGEYVAVATANKTFVLTMARRTGTGTAIVGRNPSYLYVDELPS